MGMLERLVDWVASLDPVYFSDLLKSKQNDPVAELQEADCERDQFLMMKRPPWDWEIPATCRNARYFSAEPEASSAEESNGPGLRQLAGVLASPFYMPQVLKGMLSGRPFTPDPIGGIESFLETTGISQGLRSLWGSLEESSAARKKWLAELEENGVHISESEVAEKIEEQLKGKLKNVRITLKDGRIILHATYPTKLIDLDVEGVIEVSIRKGKVDGYVKKFEVGGMNKMGTIKEELIKHLRAEDKAVPDDAELKDLSWLDSMGIKTLLIQDGRILMELMDPSSGPS